MNYIDLVKENETLIESFDLNLYLANNQIGVFTALRALETTNEAQKYYFSSDYKTNETGERILDLYGFLQSLFASIDGLYELCYQFEGSKNVLNLNDDENLRELKHIRNDVVGHPANQSRVHKNCYCVLNNDSISRFKLTYNIYSYNDVITQDVNLEELLIAYYKKTNMILRYFLKKKPEKSFNKKFAKEVLNILTSLNRDELINSINNIIARYNKVSETNDSRVKWYLEQINTLNKLKVKDKTLKNIIFDSIYFCVNKIYNILSNKNASLEYTYSKGTTNVINLIRNNKELKLNRNYLLDIKHPHFNNVYNNFKKQLLKYKSLDEYLILLEQTKQSGDSGLLFVLLFMVKLV